MKKIKKGRCAVIHADGMFASNIGKIVTIHQVLIGGAKFTHPIKGTRHTVPAHCAGMALVSGDIRCISGPHQDGIAAYSLDALVVIDDARFPQ